MKTRKIIVYFCKFEREPQVDPRLIESLSKKPLQRNGIAAILKTIIFSVLIVLLVNRHVSYKRAELSAQKKVTKPNTNFKIICIRFYLQYKQQNGLYSLVKDHRFFLQSEVSRPTLLATLLELGHASVILSTNK